MQELRTRGVVMQGHEYSCGAAALATLINLMGGNVSERDMLAAIFGENLPVVKRGDKYELRALNLADLEKGARESGFKVLSFEALTDGSAVKAVEELAPVVARLNLYGEKLHFVVVRGVSGGWAHIMDPGYGNFSVPLGTFVKSWEPGERILLAIGRRPFYTWEEKGGKLYVRRHEKESLPGEPYLHARDLYSSVRARLSSALP